MSRISVGGYFMKIGDRRGKLPSIGLQICNKIFLRHFIFILQNSVLPLLAAVSDYPDSMSDYLQYISGHLLDMCSGFRRPSVCLDCPSDQRDYIVANQTLCLAFYTICPCCVNYIPCTLSVWLFRQSSPVCLA